MARITGSHLICKALKLEGVKNVFGLAGDHILPLLDVMTDQDFRIIDTRHEQAAVHMADAWSRITEQPGVCMYTTPGFANAIPGLTNAMHTEGPVISIAGCADTHDLGRGAQQEIDQVAMAAPICKGSFMVNDARRIPEFIARAVRLAFSGRRGPVHLTIPIDIQEQSVEEDDIFFIKPEEYRPQESGFRRRTSSCAARSRCCMKRAGRSRSPAARRVTLCPATLCSVSSKPLACRS